jgi:hypothetical protein
MNSCNPRFKFSLVHYMHYDLFYSVSSVWLYFFEKVLQHIETWRLKAGILEEEYASIAK